jgi:3-phosphoshikimate 1-carboxyvinyltransferase
MLLPPTLAIRPTKEVDASLSVPGSKSLTNRALTVAALAEGQSVLSGCLLAEDSEVMVRALRTLGIPVAVSGTTMTVSGQGGRVPAVQADLDLRLSGTSIRFLTALTALGSGRYVLDGNARMRERPIQDLLDALTALGVNATSQQHSGCPPVVVEAAGLPGGEATVAGGNSSQYLSALLMAAPYARKPVTLTVTGELPSKPFVDMTLGLMADFGVTVVRDGYRRFEVPLGRYTARPYAVEGDAMAAGYLWAAAAITGGRVEVINVGLSSTQGDKRLADVLAEMGCAVTWTQTSCTVRGTGRLRGGTFDLNDMSDQAQTLAVVALFADAPVTITNIWNLRIKETDRLSALRAELTKLGARVEEGRDWITVHPLEVPPEGAVEISTYGDHRMAMAFALAGLRLPGVVIRDPSCVGKTFPTFFEVLGALEPR